MPGCSAAVSYTHLRAHDDHVIAAAVAAGADLVVSGDAALLALGRHDGIRIVTAAAITWSSSGSPGTTCGTVSGETSSALSK